PHDLDAEMSVLGSILLDPLSIAKVLQFLHSEDFYRENNGQIYRAALDLFAAGEPIDNVTLASQLQSMGLLERVGGRAQLASMQRISLQMESGQGVVGIPSGFHDLDRMTGGFKDSDLIVVAGRPAMGKTSWILNVGLHAALEAHKSVAIFSLEMSKEQLTERLLTEQAQIDAQRMHRGLLTEAEFDRVSNALGPLGEAAIYIDDTPVMDELTFQLKARQAKMRHNIDMILLDYLQLMHGRAHSDDNRVQEVSSISRALKGLARELRIPVIALSQLSRGPEARPNKRPMLSDLRDSGSIEQDADVVVFLYRDEYYNDKTEEPGICELIIAKHRNGPTDTVKLRFRKDQTMFYNLESRRRAADEE